MLRYLSSGDNSNSNLGKVPIMCLQLLGMYKYQLGRVDWVKFDLHVMQRIKLQKISKW